ncbi:hypothetical protein [Halococcus sp. AFM35]|uniref:hypothetical protein n=1 Tax=Halococcus sp. AFM35 TaxID=3421653 RepID=UPI003EBAC90E
MDGLSLLRGVRSSDELLRFGVRIMEKSLAQFSELVIAPSLVRKGLINKSMLREFVSQSPRNLAFRRGTIAVSTPQIEPNHRRGDNDTPIGQYFEDVSVSLSHPRDHGGH